MSVPIKINATGLVSGFIDRYFIWKDHCNFHQTPTAPVVEIANDGIPCYHYTDVDKINFCQSNLVVIDCLTEGIHSSNFFEQYNKNKKYIIFSNGDWDKDHYKLSIDYEIAHSHFFLWDIVDTYFSPNRFSYFSDKNYQFNSDKPYSFISTIGNVRPIRDILVDQIMTLYPRRQFVLRYSGEDFACPSDHLDVLTFEKGNFDPYISIFEKYYYNVSRSLPMAMYNSANFNLVVETDLDYQNCFFLTEKTIKVLLSGMPFVSVSHPGFLKRLHDIGFLTYDTLWDESYDEITDYKSRVKKIVELCDFLCDFDWKSKQHELEIIKFKNQTHFINLHQVAAEEFKNFEKIMLGLVQ